MPDKISKSLGVLLAVVLLAGCTGSVGVRAKSYVMDKDRIDQDMSQDGYNYGYIQGTPVPEDRSNLKKTRKMYVLEFTNEEEQPEIEVDLRPRKRVSVTSPAPSSSRSSSEPDWTRPVEIPNLDDIDMDPEPAAAQEISYEDYEVQKNDTLQKISKKFYDTYRRWPQIFEANKGTLKDPNKLKAGMMLKIPVER